MSRPTNLTTELEVPVSSTTTLTASPARSTNIVKPDEKSTSISTASLASMTGLPGWEIQQGGTLPLYTNGGQTGGYSVKLGGDQGSSTPPHDTNSEPINHGPPPKHVFHTPKETVIIVSVVLVAITLLSGLLTLVLLKRRRAKRRSSFEFRTSALRQQMQSAPYAPNAPTDMEVVYG